MATDAAAYPVTFEVEYPERLSRWLIFVKWLLAIPHLIILILFAYLLELTTLISWFAILFTARYPRPLFNLAVLYWGWSSRLGAYLGLLRDEYPPFGEDEDGEYPVNVDIHYPERLSRLLIFVKWLLAIPHMIVLFLLGVVAFAILVIAFFAILITGRFPRSLFDFTVGVSRWNLRVSAYVMLMRDEYPPFSLS